VRAEQCNLRALILYALIKSWMREERKKLGVRHEKQNAEDQRQRREPRTGMVG